MSDNGTSCIEIAGTANALFLRSFEEWLLASIKCNEHGKTPEQRVENIKSSYERAIKGNVEYHNMMHEVEKTNGNNESAALHWAMAQAYSSLIG
jgi:hypothetical protein